ncbi:hypothetical protein [Allomuricauda sp. d1]|uniref:hypothetical protein n=1 Tax=Allomuricauda sp. d1 TaxID=3136725 RepID=UPI0031DD64E1
MKKIAGIIMGFVFLVGCGGGDDGPPPQPEAPALVFPLQNSECTTGQDVSETQTQVTFEWQASANTDSYTLSVVNLNTNVSLQPITTQNTMASVSIDKGTPFSWTVTSRNQASGLTAVSDSWLFYNEGAQTNYAPFPAQIMAPQPGSTINANAMGQTTLKWNGTDVEDDIASYEVYFSEQNSPEVLATTDANTTETTVNISSGTTYYWKIVTIDAQGNESDSGVFDFKVL